MELRSKQLRVPGGRLGDLLGTGFLLLPATHEGRRSSSLGIPKGYLGHQERQESEGMICAWGAEAEGTCCRGSLIHIDRDFITACPSGQAVLIGSAIGPDHTAFNKHGLINMA